MSILHIDTPSPQTGDTAGLAVWLTGLSGAGKSTIAAEVVRRLSALGMRCDLLDADTVRKHLSGDLGFDRAGREENVRRIAYVAGLLARHGVVVVVAAMSPYREGRDAARRAIGNFLEVYVDAPIDICEQRDPIGLYRRFRSGEVRHLSGKDEAFEAPLRPDVHCLTEPETPAQSAEKVVRAVLKRVTEGTTTFG